MNNYENYGDWYDNGPGSEAFKRSLQYSQRPTDKIDEMLEVIYKALVKIQKEKEAKEKKKIELPDELFEI